MAPRSPSRRLDRRFGRVPDERDAPATSDEDKAGSSQDSQPPSDSTAASTPSTDATTARPTTSSCRPISTSTSAAGRSTCCCWGEPVRRRVDRSSSCPGTGPTTVVLGATWPHSFAPEGHHLCAYDRAGVGEQRGAARRTGAPRTTRSADLVALLDGCRPEGAARHGRPLHSARLPAIGTREPRPGAGRRGGVRRPAAHHG